MGGRLGRSHQKSEYHDKSPDELRQMTNARGITQNRCGGVLEAEASTLRALLRAHDLGKASARSLDAGSASSDLERPFLRDRGLSGEGFSRGRLGSVDGDCSPMMRPINMPRHHSTDMVMEQIFAAPGPKGVDIGGTLVKIALALPASEASEPQNDFPTTFGGGFGQTRPDLEFDFEIEGERHRLRFVSGPTYQIEGAVDSFRSSGRPTSRGKRSSLQGSSASGGSGGEDPERAEDASKEASIASAASSAEEGAGGATPTSWEESQKLFTAGGGAHKFAPLFRDALGVELVPVKELQSVVDGLLFLANKRQPNCLFTVNEREEAVDEAWPEPLFPLILVNMGSGVSILHVKEDGSFARIGGTACGGGTFLGLSRALTGVESFQEALAMAEGGNPANCDLLVSDIYGEEGSAALGLPGNLTASNFGKFNMPQDHKPDLATFGAVEEAPCSNKDVARALLQMITQQSVLLSIALARSEKCMDRIFFVGGFVEHENWIARSSIAKNFRSLGARAHFLRHSDFLGSLGSLRACLRGTA